MCEREREREKKNYLPDKNAFRREKIDFYKEGMKEWKEEGLKKCDFKNLAKCITKQIWLTLNKNS